MSTPQIVFTAIVLFIGFPSAFLNRTAAALVASWSIQELIWLVTGSTADTLTGFVLDYGVLLAIIMKPDRRTLWDFAVAGIFPVMWGAHFVMVDLYRMWWALWWLALAQFACAAIGAVMTYRAGPRPEEPIDPFGRFMAAYRMAWT